MSDYGERLKALRKARYPDFSEDMDMHDITDGISWMADRIEELEAKLAKAVELVERAFNEGVGEGMNDVLRQSGGKTWYDSRSRATLAELTGGKDE